MSPRASVPGLKFDGYARAFEQLPRHAAPPPTDPTRNLQHHLAHMTPHAKVAFANNSKHNTHQHPPQRGVASIAFSRNAYGNCARTQ